MDDIYSSVENNILSIIKDYQSQLIKPQKEDFDITDEDYEIFKKSSINLLLQKKNNHQEKSNYINKHVNRFYLICYLLIGSIFAIYTYMLILKKAPAYKILMSFFLTFVIASVIIISIAEILRHYLYRKNIDPFKDIKFDKTGIISKTQKKYQDFADAEKKFNNQKPKIEMEIQKRIKNYLNSLPDDIFSSFILEYKYKNNVSNIDEKDRYIATLLDETKEMVIFHSSNDLIEITLLKDINELKNTLLIEKATIFTKGMTSPNINVYANEYMIDIKTTTQLSQELFSDFKSF